MVDVIAEIHDLYDRTKDAAIDKRDKEFIENLACTVDHYFNQQRLEKNTRLLIRKAL